MHVYPPVPHVLTIRPIQIAGIDLRIECLKDLEQTIDQLFDVLQAGGDPSLLEEFCPYFGVIWPSALALAEAVAERDSLIRGSEVLEIGCGLAIPSLVASRLGARVTATDFHPLVSEFLNRNVALNQIRNLNYLRIDWRNETKQAELPQYPWVIASDVLYERQHPELVARAMHSHLSPGGTAIIADPARPYLQSFVQEAEKLGFTHELSVRKDIFIITLKKQAV
ncbi:MAG TPA: methyltransferase domain-containing protein [Bdellovibrionota bacterium]|nr:methyltransferase domain-containing protein [Bdellovibrionota bacterium]